MRLPRLKIVAERRVYYGWWIVLGACVLQTLGAGFYLLGFTAFVLPLADEFDAARGPISLALGLSTLAGALLGPVQGYFVDRYGPRPIMILGVTLMGLGFVLLSTATSLVWFYVYFIPFIGLGAGMGIMSTAHVAVNNWFVRKRGTAFGITMSGVGLGGLIVALTQLLVSTLGWREAALIIGIIVWSVGYPMASLMRRRPEDYGLLPDGVQETGDTDKVNSSQPTDEIDFTVREAFASRAFWLVIIGFGVRNMVSAGVFLHFIPAMVDRGFSEGSAALVIALIGILTIPGRLLSGRLQDKIEKRKVAGGTGVLIALALLVFVLGQGTWAIVLFVVLYAVGWGGSSPSQQAIRGAYFGRTHFAKIAGFGSMIQTMGVLIGPTFAGYSYDATLSYDLSFTTFAGVAVLSAVLLWKAKRPIPKRLRTSRLGSSARM